MTQTALLHAENLSVGRGDRMLLAGFSLSLAPGELVHLRGRNGAGKTSLLEVLAGLRAPRGGSVQRTAGLHWLGHKNALNPALSPLENLRFWCALHAADAAAIVPALERLGLGRLRHRPSRSLSAGQKRRCALARLLLRRHALWLLDEPLSGLDAEGLERFGELLAGHLADGGAAVVTSHQSLPGGAAARQLELGR